VNYLLFALAAIFSFQETEHAEISLSLSQTRFTPDDNIELAIVLTNISPSKFYVARDILSRNETVISG
jgi:hypothetical protein